MRIGKLTNGRSCEFKMQDKMKEWLSVHGFPFIDELMVKEVKRRADFLVIKPGNGLINIEAKCNDFDCMMKQLDDHAAYCDYSFAFIPDYSMTPAWFKVLIVKRGYGLIVYNWETGGITEVLEAHCNRPKNKKLRRLVIEKIYLDNIHNSYCTV